MLTEGVHTPLTLKAQAHKGPDAVPVGAGGWVGCGGGPGRGAGELTRALGYSFWKSPLTVSMRFWASLQTRAGCFERQSVVQSRQSRMATAPVTPYRRPCSLDYIKTASLLVHVETMKFDVLHRLSNERWKRVGKLTIVLRILCPLTVLR